MAATNTDEVMQGRRLAYSRSSLVGRDKFATDRTAHPRVIWCWRRVWILFVVRPAWWRSDEVVVVVGGGIGQCSRPGRRWYESWSQNGFVSHDSAEGAQKQWSCSEVDDVWLNAEGGTAHMALIYGDVLPDTPIRPTECSWDHIQVQITQKTDELGLSGAPPTFMFPGGWRRLSAKWANRDCDAYICAQKCGVQSLGISR